MVLVVVVMTSIKTEFVTTSSMVWVVVALRVNDWFVVTGIVVDIVVGKKLLFVIV